MIAPQAAWLDQGVGRRLHLQHGPIDLIIAAFGPAEAVEQAYNQAWARFQTILEELVAELPLLRQPLGAVYPLLRGATARRMAAACWPHRGVYITPMAAVAGAVAEEILRAMAAGAELRKAYVNNGGDIALLLQQGESFNAAVVGNPDQPHIDAVARLEATMPSRGIATSGWRGRSFSRGIADAVTILAATAAQADAAATIIGNAVNADHPAIQRRPASELKDDSDLGEILVTENVGTLPNSVVAEALSAGLAVAHDLRRRGLIQAAYLSLQGETAVSGGAGELTTSRVGNGR
jgi:ApbE superfamily uncharacterized protein (UPF0280 family)